MTVNSLEPKPGQIKPRSYYLRLAITQRGLTVHAGQFCQSLSLTQCARNRTNLIEHISAINRLPRPFIKVMRMRLDNTFPFPFPDPVPAFSVFQLPFFSWYTYVALKLIANILPSSMALDDSSTAFKMRIPM